MSRQPVRPSRDALVEAIDGVTQIIRQRGYPDVDIAVVRPKVIRLLEEGLTFKQIADALVLIANTKEDDKVLGLRASSKTTVADLDNVAVRLGLNDDTPGNRVWWESKFKAKVAAYWCPKCGYAGNQEFTTGMCGDISCFRCTFSGDSRYFTRKWTTDEQAEYEEQVRRERDEQNRLYLERTEKARRQREFMEKLRADAVTVVKRLYEDDDDLAFDEELADTHIKWVMQIASRPRQFGFDSIPPDELIAAFRAERDTTKDIYDQFEEVAKRIDKIAQGETND
ncbi:MAG: hypothetical protein ACLQLC_06965 [Candidatus Sulfotelmatobacter sp.]